MGYTNWTLIIEILLVIIFLYLLYDFFAKGRVRRKIGKKKDLICIFSIIIIFIAFTFVRPILLNKYTIKNSISKSCLDRYIDNYELSGYKDSTVTIKALSSFNLLDDKTKFEYMNNVRTSVETSIYKNFDDGFGSLNLMKLVKDEKVIVNIDGHQYECYSDDLTLDGKEVYQNKVVTNNNDNNDYEYSYNDYEYGYNDKTPASLTDEDQTRIRVLTQKVVSDRLKVPSSAKFGGIDEFKIRSGEGGTYTCSGWVEGENDFGGTVRNNFVVTFDRKNGELYAINVDIY